MIAVAIVAAAGGAWAAFGYWHAVEQLWKQVTLYLSKSASFPLWAVYLNCIFLMVAIGYLGLDIYFVFRKPKPKPQLAYTSDIFDQLLWRWKYGEGGEFYSVAPHCTQCDFQVYQDVQMDIGKWKTYYKCKHCTHGVPPYKGTYEEHIDEVSRKIMRNLNTGEYKKRMELLAQPHPTAEKEAKRLESS